VAGSVAAQGAVAATGRARVRACAWDYLVISAWIGLLAVAGLGVRAVLPGEVTVGLPGTDLLAFACSVLPVWLYLTCTESGVRQASWGKRRAGLLVVEERGARPGRGRVAVRNAVKLVPWQLAHLAVARLLLGVAAPGVIGVTYGLSLVIPAVSVATAWRDPHHRGLHDLVAGTRVVPAA